jgi:hypothetical protein
MKTPLITEGSGPVYQGEQHCLLVCQMVMTLSILIEISVGRLSIYCIWASVVDIDIQGKVAIYPSLHGELDVIENAV